MNIMFVSPSEGGIAHYSYALVSALVDQSATVQLVTGYTKYEIACLPHDGIRLHHIYSKRKSVPQIVTAALNFATLLWASLGCEVIHIQWRSAKMDKLIYPILKLLGKTIVFTVHDVIDNDKNMSDFEYRNWIYNFSDKLIVHTDSLKDQLIDTFQVSGSKITVINFGNYNFVNDLLGSKPVEVNAFDVIRFTYFGYIRKYKGIDILLQSLALVKKKLSDIGETRPFHCNIVGKSQEGFWEAAGYDNQITLLGIQDVVRLDIRHVPFEEIPSIFANTDVALVPYVNASQSAVVPLAYAFSKPVIASQVGGIPDVVKHGITGVLVEPGNVDQLAENIVQFIQNPQSAITMGQAARKFADTELDWATIATKTIECYRL